MTSPPPKQLAEAYRYCPQCGTANPSPGQSPLRCPACGFTVFFGPYTAVGAVLVNDGGEVLFVRRARDPGKGKWGLPGGFVDAYETAEDALRREVTEETGLQIKHLEFLLTHPNRYCYQGVEAPVLDVFFACKVAGDNRITLDESELEHYRWQLPDPAMLANLAFESNRQAVLHWMHHGAV
ncbi:MAG: hypothetical protein KatS3mg111_3765 [Pirellulaceae bacterium]|nr:MAG: hypothetical protein KatS3mg111_3765 [Pirellulaceae bacterium]